MIGKTKFHQGCASIVMFLMLLFSVSGCKTPAPTQKAPMMTYYYTDGMSNTYVLTADSLKFDPITPERSSSGVADGGEKKAVALSKAQFEMLESKAKDAMTDVANHVKTRLMGCGTLTLEDASGEETIFISMNAESKVRLEDALKQALK